MTREEAVYKQGLSDNEIEALVIAPKALEYPPEKLNKWIRAEVLEIIKVKLHSTAEMHEDGSYYLREEWIDEIINQYEE